MWLASYVITLASKTGWSEDYILGLPLARGHQYIHAIARANGAATIATDAGLEQELTDLWQK